MLGLHLGPVWPGLSATSALLAFADDTPTNQEALALSPKVGWLLLTGAVALIAYLILHAQWWRRFWLTKEDPRTLALYRIVFGFFVICNVNDFWEYFIFLFSDEGIFTADVARQVHGSAQFAGFGDGLTEEEPWGFFDRAAVIEWLKGPKYSLLYFWDTPTFVWGHIAAFEICAVLFMIGFRTRLFGILTFLLMNSLFVRNHLFWEGTELVYRVFLAYLICAKSGHAYSVDNWLRCRKLRKQGLLSERNGPGGGAGVAPDEAHPRGLEAVYRLIPAWPQRLMMLQLAAVYATTGILKNGGVWAKGDAIYYAWNMDHFYRFYPQQISALIGTNLLRLATWFTHWGEALFFVCMFGIFAHFGMREGLEPLRGAKRVVASLCWATMIAVSGAVIYVTWPVHFSPPMRADVFTGLWIAMLAGLWGFWRWIGRRPIHLGRLRPRRHLADATANKIHIAVFCAVVIGVAAMMAAWPAALEERFPEAAAIALWITVIPGLWGAWMLVRHEAVVDQGFVARWIVGRRIWLTFHVMLMGGIFTLMNIGQFQTGMLAQGIIFFAGFEVAFALRWFGRVVLPRLLGKSLFGRFVAPMVPKHVLAGEMPLPAEDPTLPHHRRDAARLPQWAMFIGLGVFLLGILVKVDLRPTWEWRWIWVVGIVFLAGVAFQRWMANGREQLPVEPHDGPRTRLPDGEQSLRRPWAYGPFGRFVIGSLLVWQITAVTVWLLPEKDSLGQWRSDARKVFSKWLTVTQTDQGWGMFAPNPPRSNVFLKVLVTDANGEVYDLKTDVYALEKRPIPFIWNDRMRKMNRRIIGGESGNTQWYRKWYARYICRQWALEHDGETPQKVELVKMWYRIPSPEDVKKRGWYQPDDLMARSSSERIEHTEHCKRAVMGQLPDWIRERHGLEPLPEDTPYKPWIKHKRRKWEQTLEKRQAQREKQNENSADE